MNVKYETSFKRDLKRIKNRESLHLIHETISDVKRAQNLRRIKKIKKLKNRKNYYRIKLGSYRIGIKVENKTVIFVRILHRKDIYRYFP